MVCLCAKVDRYLPEKELGDVFICQGKSPGEESRGELVCRGWISVCLRGGAELSV